MRRLVLLLAAGLALSACGDTPAPATDPRVKLKLSDPVDGTSVFDDHVALRGTVTPEGAAVVVAGEAAQVDGTTFTAEVKLDPGTNVIDITATADGRRPATDAVRVTRDLRIKVPTLVGSDPEDADAELSAVGLKAQEERGGSWIDKILGGLVTVCATVPPEGTRVDPGSTVTLQTAPSC